MILIFIAWPVAGFAAWIYIFISPFAACLGSGKLRMMRNQELTTDFIGCEKISDFCQKGVEWPRALGKAIKDGDSSFGCWTLTSETSQDFSLFCLNENLDYRVQIKKSISPKTAFYCSTSRL